MALQKDRPLRPNSKIKIPGAYCRIDGLQYAVGAPIHIVIGVYEDWVAANPTPVATAADPEPKPVESRLNRLDVAKYTFLVADFGDKGEINAATAYALLKTQEEWKDAEDV